MSPWNTRMRWLRTSGVGVVALLTSSGCAMGPEDFGPQVTSSAVTEGSAITQFRDVLSPYGTWVNLPDVGWVWQPAANVVGADFVPYATGGQWVSSDWGWTFQTDWNWGWAPFHYGRWFNRPSEGWVWWPDSEWAPSWVDWRWGDGYVGWQPLAPPGLNIGLAWTFVGANDFVRPEVGRYRVPLGRAPELLRQTRPVGEHVVSVHGDHWNRGPEPSEVSRVTGRPVPLARPMTPPTGHPPRARTGPTTAPSRPTSSTPHRGPSVSAAPHEAPVARPEAAVPHEQAVPRSEPAVPHEPAVPRSEPAAPHEAPHAPHAPAPHGESHHGR